MKISHKLLLVTFLILGACKEEVKKVENKTETPKNIPSNVVKDIQVPIFDGNAAYNYVKKQVEFGPRVPNSAGHKKCGDFLVNEFAKVGLSVIEQKAILTAFDGTKLNARNIIASLNPDAEKRILLMAHWDTRPFADQDSKDRTKPILGANDGASGVAVLLEVANILVKDSLKIGIDIILFDAEDYGQPEGTMVSPKPDTYCLGSQYWAKNKHKANYKAEFGILLDMVGAKDAVFTKEGTSVYYAPQIVNKVWDIARYKGYEKYFSYQQTNPITDDHFYVNEIAKIPSIDIIHYDASTPSHFGKYWHTHNDNLEAVDAQTLQIVGQVLLEVIYREN